MIQTVIFDSERWQRAVLKAREDFFATRRRFARREAKADPRHSRISRMHRDYRHRLGRRAYRKGKRP